MPTRLLQTSTQNIPFLSPKGKPQPAYPPERRAESKHTGRQGLNELLPFLPRPQSHFCAQHTQHLSKTWHKEVPKGIQMARVNFSPGQVDSGRESLFKGRLIMMAKAWARGKKKWFFLGEEQGFGFLATLTDMGQRSALRRVCRGTVWDSGGAVVLGDSPPKRELTVESLYKLPGNESNKFFV